MLIRLAEKGWVPDTLIRMGIRHLLNRRLRQEGADEPDEREQRKQQRMDEFCHGPMAVEQQAANDQHYEVPAGFYEQVLGPRLKYSSGLWDGGVSNLAEAEEAMLALTCERAHLDNGQRILELGCGWGSLTLWMAEQYPDSQITAVSNSTTQKAWIDAQAARSGLNNVSVITADVAQFAPEDRFDRVVSVEMFEHMRNHATLMGRIADWLLPEGLLFVHIFCHRELFYPFEDQGSSSWMSRMFFSGGVMPSFDLLQRCQHDLPLERAWKVDGRHYARTLEAWLDNADEKEHRVLPVLEQTYGQGQGRLWLQRWRIFFMACAELFAYREGSEWFVGHYLFRKPSGKHS